MSRVEPEFTPTAGRPAQPVRLSVEGVLQKRVVAYLMDVVFIATLLLIGSGAMALLGVATLGLAWLFWGLVAPGVPLVYYTLTLGGARAATPGMQIMGLHLRTLIGTPPGLPLAMAHAGLFWISVAMTAGFVLLIAFFTPRGRCLHDLLTGTVVVNR